jgi:hypothetical protein
MDFSNRRQDLSTPPGDFGLKTVHSCNKRPKELLIPRANRVVIPKKVIQKIAPAELDKVPE